MKTNEIIKQMIPLTGMSQTQVAEAAGISKSQLSQYLSGNASANKDVLDKLLTLTGIHLDTYAKRAQLAAKVAKKLKAAGVTEQDIKAISKKEMAAKSGCPEVKCFFDATADQLHKALDSGLIECQVTFAYFKALVLIMMEQKDTRDDSISAKDINSSWAKIASAGALGTSLASLALPFAGALISGAVAGLVMSTMLSAKAIDKFGKLKGDMTASIVELALSLAKEK